MFFITDLQKSLELPPLMVQPLIRVLERAGVIWERFGNIGLENSTNSFVGLGEMPSGYLRQIIFPFRLTEKKPDLLFSYQIPICEGEAVFEPATESWASVRSATAHKDDKNAQGIVRACATRLPFYPK